MADNLIQKSHKSSEKNKYNNVVHRTTSESLRLNESDKGVTHPMSLQGAHNPRKISSFQITSVTEGIRVSTDAGEDSCDDLDESHTDDISRVTDIENETPSYSEDTFSKDDVFYNASSASLGCAPVIPTSSQYGLAIVGQDHAAGQTGAVPNSNSTEGSDMHVSVTNAGTGSIINLIGNAKPQEGMKEIQEHVRNERFKVVKIESTEPFRRGRWMCMDYLDHTTTNQNAPITLNNNLDVSESGSLQAPDSGVVINDSQHDDLCNDLTNKGPKDLQGNAPIVQQLDQSVQKQFPMASPGQSLTQPLNVVQQPMPVTQSVSVQSPPLEMPQQMPNQNIQPPQQVAQSMTHITMQNAPQNHPQAPQQQQVQQIPQSFPQHQLQQVIAQSQGMAMQQMPMHQQIPQQMQQIPNQQMQQINQHLPQAQMPNMQQMQQQMPQMQGIPNQGQMPQVTSQQPQMQQIQMQQMTGQPNAQQLHQMQQAQMPNMGQSHHLQGQQPMAAQQQLQHMPSQAQIQALQNQQLPNHIQQMQIPAQLAGPNQQIPQMQPQMHQLPSQPQQTVVPGMHPQMQQQAMPVQPQYNQAVNQQSTGQAMMNTTIPSSQQMVQPQHSVPQYHAQQPQMSQQGQTLPQEVLTSIVTSQQGATLPSNLQPMANQPQGSTLPANLQSLSQQQAPVHSMAPQQGSVPQGNMQMMSAPQNMQMTLDGNQPSMQIPASDPIFMQQANVGQQMPVGQHMTQQSMMPQQVSGQGQMGGVQYVANQAVTQVSMAHQNMPMSMQQSMPVGMGGGVHANVVQSQTSMGLGYGGVVPVMSQSSVAPVEATVSGTNSPVVSLPVSSTAYVGNAGQPGHEGQGFGSPVSGVVSHAMSGGAVISNVNVSASDSGGAEVGVDSQQAADIGDGKDEAQSAPNTEDESISGLALALGSSGAGSPAAEARDLQHTAASSRAPSPPPADRQQHSSCRIKAYKNTVSTGNLSRHLKEDHCIKEKDKATHQKISSFFDVNRPSTSQFQSGTQQRDKKWLLGRDLVLWICRSLLPFDSVSDEAMIDFFLKYKIIIRKEDLPCRTTISRTALDDIYESMKSHILLLITETSARFAALTTDLWSDNYKRKNYITITLQFLDDMLNLVNCTLATRLIEGKKTGEKIKEYIQAILLEFGMEEKRFVIVTDSGSNVKRAVSLSSLESHLCLGHGLHNLVMVDGIKSTPEICRIVEKCKKIVKCLRFKLPELEKEADKEQRRLLVEMNDVGDIIDNDENSPLSEDENENEEPLLDSNVPSIKTASPTRWNSVLTMLESIYNRSNRNPIHNLLNKVKKPELKIEEHEWKLLGSLINLFDKFKDATKILSASKITTINVALVLRCEIQTILKGMLDEESLVITKLKKNMLDKLNHRMPINELVVAAALLDCRFQAMEEIDRFLEERGQTRVSFLSAYTKRIVKLTDLPKSIEACSEVPLSTPTTSSTVSFLMQLSKKHSQAETHIDDPIDVECWKYFGGCDPGDLLDGDVLNYWRNKKNACPWLYSLATAILCVPATSTPSERVFSVAGLTINAKRSRLNPNNVDKIVFIHDNYQLCKSSLKKDGM